MLFITCLLFQSNLSIRCSEVYSCLFASSAAWHATTTLWHSSTFLCISPEVFLLGSDWWKTKAIFLSFFPTILWDHWTFIKMYTSWMLEQNHEWLQHPRVGTPGHSDKRCYRAKQGGNQVQKDRTFCNLQLKPFGNFIMACYKYFYTYFIETMSNAIQNTSWSTPWLDFHP